MATEVDICNLALSYIGDRANITSINPPEDSVQADYCARLYPIARNQMLEEHAWSFATRRVSLAKIATPPVNAKNAFTVPSDCARLIAVFDGKAPATKQIEEYSIENHNGYKVITCACDDIYIKYVSFNTPAAVFSSTFADTLAHLLASKLAGQLIPGTTGAALGQEELKIFSTMLIKAVNQDVSQMCEKETYVNPFVGDLNQGGYHGYN